MNFFERLRRTPEKPSHRPPVVIRGEIVVSHIFEDRLADYDFALGNAYGDAINGAEPLDPGELYKGVVPYEISLRDIPPGLETVRRNQLRAKLNEYDKRIEDQWQKTWTFE